MGVTWATCPLGEVVHPFDEGDTLEADTGWGFSVGGVITSRITKLFPTSDSAWRYGELEYGELGQGDRFSHEPQA